MAAVLGLNPSAKVGQSSLAAPSFTGGQGNEISFHEQTSSKRKKVSNSHHTTKILIENVQYTNQPFIFFKCKVNGSAVPQTTKSLADATQVHEIVLMGNSNKVQLHISTTIPFLLHGTYHSFFKITIFN